MRIYPRNFIEFKEKHNFHSEDLTLDNIKDRYASDVIFRNDLAFLSLFRSLKRSLNRNVDIHLQSEMSEIMPKSTRQSDWQSFQKETELYIPNLSYQQTKIGYILLIICVFTILLILYKINSNLDLSFFTYLHTEAFYLAIGVPILVCVLIYNLYNKFFSKKDQFPLPLNTIKNITIQQALAGLISQNLNTIRESVEFFKEEINYLASIENPLL